MPTEPIIIIVDSGGEDSEADGFNLFALFALFAFLFG